MAISCFSARSMRMSRWCETVLATLPTKARGQVFIEVDDEAAIRELSAPGRVCVTWLLRDRGQSLRTAVDAWLGEMLPVEFDREHRVYAWVSGDQAAASSRTRSRRRGSVLSAARTPRASAATPR